MTHKYPDNETRLEKVYKRLGTRNPSCVTCDESDPLCMELHHIAGKDHHDGLAIVCRNCHRKLSDRQYDRTECNPVDPEIGTIGHFLLGLSDMFAMLATTLKVFGQRLLTTEPHVSDDEAQ